MKDEAILTTIDNPYNPFVQWEEWYAYDTQKGHHTCSYLDRITNTDSVIEEAELTLLAMTNIVRNDPLGKYKIVLPVDFQQHTNGEQTNA